MGWDVMAQGDSFHKCLVKTYGGINRLLLSLVVLAVGISLCLCIAACGRASRTDGSKKALVEEAETIVADENGQTVVSGRLARRESATTEGEIAKDTVTYVLELDRPTSFEGPSGRNLDDTQSHDGIREVQVGARLALARDELVAGSSLCDNHWEWCVGDHVTLKGDLLFPGTDDASYSCEVALEDAWCTDIPYEPLVTPRDDPSDYTWVELCRIADLLASAYTDQSTSQSDIDNLYLEYGLVDEDLQRREVSKELVLSDGTSLECRLVDTGREEASRGQNLFPTGMTFMCTGDAQAHSFASEDGATWSESGLRLWLHEEVLPLLPVELSTNIVLSCKHRGSVQSLAQVLRGHGDDSRDYDWHGPDDYLWAPSASELVGTVGLGQLDESDDTGESMDLLSSEGNQFAAFAVDGGSWTDADAGSKRSDVESGTSPKGLDTGRTCWLRSVSPSTGSSLVVTADGNVGYAGDASDELGVVFCFNLGIERYPDGYEKGSARTYPDPDDTYLPAGTAVVADSPTFSLADRDCRLALNSILSRFTQSGACYLASGFDRDATPANRWAWLALNDFASHGGAWESAEEPPAAMLGIRVATKELDYFPKGFCDTEVDWATVEDELEMCYRDGYVYVAITDGFMLSGPAIATEARDLGDGTLLVKLVAYSLDAKGLLPQVENDSGKLVVDDSVYMEGAAQINDMLGMDGPNVWGTAVVEYAQASGGWDLKLVRLVAPNGN